MTISTTTSVITYQGNGSTTSFTFPYVSGGSATDITVIITDNLGHQTTLAPSQYTLTLNAVPVGGLWSIGGTVTYPISGSPLAIGNYITIQRDVPYVQSVSINNQGAFYPQAVELALDDLELQIQQIETNQSYSIQVPNTDIAPPSLLPPAAQRANMFLIFDSGGNPTVTASQPSVVSVANANPRKVTVTGTNTITMLTTDSLAGISVYQSSSPVTSVQLPSTLGPYPVFDGGDNAATYPITILPPAGKTILGQTSYVINTVGGSATFWLDGTEVLVS